MPDWVRWLFDGIGTELISIVIGVIIGGFGGFAVGRRTRIQQVQNAGDNSKQAQSTFIDIDTKDNQRTKESENILQKQSAGKNAVQSQVGKTNHEQ